jgi:hypothetical protein
MDTYWQNKKSISLSSSGTYMWREVPVSIIPKSFSGAVCLLRKTERKMTYLGATASEVARLHHESATEESLDELPD